MFSFKAIHLLRYRLFRITIFMKTAFLCIFFTLGLSSLTAQEEVNFQNSFTEETTDSQKFQIYLDTIFEYSRNDIRIVKQAFRECQALIDRGFDMSDAVKFEYGIALISYALDSDDELAALNHVQEYQHLQESQDITDNSKKYFKYLEAFTYMAVGDPERAQTLFYNIIEEAKEAKDTTSLINALLSLGQILSKEEQQYETALEYFNQGQALSSLSKVQKAAEDDHSIFRLEISDLYIKQKKYDEALQLINEGLQFIEENNILYFKQDFLLKKSIIELQRNDYKAAQQALDEAFDFMEKSESTFLLDMVKKNQGEIFEAQGLYGPALEIYEELISKDNKSSPSETLGYLENAHKVCDKMGNKNKAYAYLSQAAELQEKIYNEKKLQQTAYLKIKFDSAQKEKENQLLATKVQQKQSQLYAILGLATLGLLTLFGAYYQKRKYNNLLKKEVQSRTKDLEEVNLELSKTNKELDEFNRILSHDLREPLRSIIGFSSLARKENIEKSKKIEYLNFIEGSGKQLNKIIDDVSTFQNISDLALQQPEHIDTEELLENAVKSIRKEYPQKPFEIGSSELPMIFNNKSIIQLVFLNLLENGIKYNQNSIPKIQIQYKEKDSFHHFEFQDNGIGIEPEYHEKIFDMFERLHTRENYSGSGLGLSITKKMIEILKGKINILESNINQGSIFKISFPILREEVA